MFLKQIRRIQQRASTKLSGYKFHLHEKCIGWDSPSHMHISCLSFQLCVFCLPAFMILLLFMPYHSDISLLFPVSGNSKHNIFPNSFDKNKCSPYKTISFRTVDDKVFEWIQFVSIKSCRKCEANRKWLSARQPWTCKIHIRRIVVDLTSKRKQRCLPDQE